MVVLGLSAALPSGAGATTHRKAPPAVHKPKLLQQGHLTFWECKSKTTVALIGVNTLVLHPGQSLTINFIVRNESAKTCDYVAPYVGVVPGPTATTLEVGPCGAVGFEIEGPHHRNLWPGVVTYNCPALGFAQLAPNGTTVGSGTWNQTRPGGTARVPVGHDTLVVAGHFSFPITIDAH
jgi:hypothetical protein